MAARLDAIDQQILKELQEDGRITNVELARRVGISAPPCLRRVRALEEAGYIKGYRALLDEKLLGYEVSVFAMVHLTSQADADLKTFEDFVRAQPLVRECWMLSGEIDFILKCVAPDLKTFQAAHAAQLQRCGHGADGGKATLTRAGPGAAMALVIAQHRRARSQSRASPRAKTARVNAAIPQASCRRRPATRRNNCCRSP